MPIALSQTAKRRVAGSVVTVAIAVAVVAAGGGPALAENYQWPSSSYVDCGGSYRPTVSSRATMNVQHFQSQRGSQGWWDASPLWSNGNATPMRDFRVQYTQSQLAKILSTGYFGDRKSWLCE